MANWHAVRRSKHSGQWRESWVSTDDGRTWLVSCCLVTAIVSWRFLSILPSVSFKSAGQVYQQTRFSCHLMFRHAGFQIKKILSWPKRLRTNRHRWLWHLNVCVNNSQPINEEKEGGRRRSLFVCARWYKFLGGGVSTRLEEWCTAILFRLFKLREHDWEYVLLGNYFLWWSDSYVKWLIYIIIFPLQRSREIGSTMVEIKWAWCHFIGHRFHYPSQKENKTNTSRVKTNAKTGVSCGRDILNK